MFKALIQGYYWNSISELFASQFPSAKYQIGLLLVFVSGWGAMVEQVFGFQTYTLIAFVVAALLELFTGIYASVVSRGEPFESGKFGRWGLKFIILMLGLFVVHQFGRGWDGSNSIISDCFNWIYAFLFIEGALEYTLSIFENYAMMSGKPKDYYVKTITDKVNALLNNNSQTPPPSI